MRAALEAIAYQIKADLVGAMASDCGQKPSELRVDGGASANQFLVTAVSGGCAGLQSYPARRYRGTTALGAALLAGLAVGVWKNMDEIRRVWQVDLKPGAADERTQEREKAMVGWHRAVRRSMRWAAEED